MTLNITSNLQRYSYAVILSLLVTMGIAIVSISVKSLIMSLLIVSGSLVLGYIFFKNGKLSLKRVTMPLLFVSVLFPSIRFLEGIPALRIDLILIVVAWILFILGNFSIGKVILFKWITIYKWFFLFGMSIFASIIYVAMVENYYPIGRDFFEFAKLIQYFLIFALIANMNITPRDMRKYYIISLSIFTCSALFGFAQFFNLLNINDILSPIYAPTQIRGLLVHQRITGTAANPNEFAALMVLSSSISLVGALWMKGFKFKLISSIVFVISVFAIVLTLSRSGLLSLLIAVVFILILKYPLCAGLGETVRTYFWGILILFILLFAIIMLAPEKFFFRTGEILNFTLAYSWVGRVEAWNVALAHWLQSPLFGWGPGKATMTTIVDNEWFLLLRRYGVIGVTIFVLWFGSIYFKLSKIYREISDTYSHVFIIGLQATMIAYAVYMILAGIYHSLQLMPILMFFFGLAYSQRRSQKENSVE